MSLWSEGWKGSAMCAGIPLSKILPQSKAPPTPLKLQSIAENFLELDCESNSPLSHCNVCGWTGFRWQE